MTTLPLKTLKADPDNPRTITDQAATGLGVSMEKLGDLSVIVWNETTGELAAGHQRMTRLQRAGAKTWVRIDETAGYVEHPKTGERFAIRIVQWDRATQRLANIVANNPHLQGQFTAEVLTQIGTLVDDEQREQLLLGQLQAIESARLREDEWKSDIDLERHGSHIDGIDAKIIVFCKQEHREKILAKITAALKGVRDVDIR